MSDEVLLAWQMNGQPLPRTHGGPVRVVVPGYIGARSVKWVTTITVQRGPSQNYFQALDYRILPPEADPDTVPEGEGISLSSRHCQVGGWSSCRRGSRIVIAADSLYKGFRFPEEIISHAVWLYYRFLLSGRLHNYSDVIRSHTSIRLREMVPLTKGAACHEPARTALLWPMPSGQNSKPARVDIRHRIRKLCGPGSCSTRPKAWATTRSPHAWTRRAKSSPSGANASSTGVWPD